MAKVGISAVAQAAGVSEATVSRVINNRGVVAPETRRSVEDAMRRVGYSQRGTTMARTVLLIVPGLSNPFFGRLCDRIGELLVPLGLQALIASAPVGGTQDYEHVSSMLDHGIVGAVFVSANNTLVDADPTAHRLLASRGVPYVCIDGAFRDGGAPALSTDDALASELAVAHLWELGHRRIALAAGHSGNIPSDRRIAGFREALRRRGVEQPVVIHQEYSVEGGASAASRLLEDGVTGIVAASDEMAFGVLQQAGRRGLRVPEDVSVIGYDDAHPLEFIDPPLTTLRQPIDRLAQAAVSILQRLVQGRSVEAVELLYDPELVVRASTGPAHE
jgi:LacI family transcriptional regulator, repressor for deo operon, udp, cdd, tsx, nupC, and nupG